MARLADNISALPKEIHDAIAVMVEQMAHDQRSTNYASSNIDVKVSAKGRTVVFQLLNDSGALLQSWVFNSTRYVHDAEEINAE